MNLADLKRAASESLNHGGYFVLKVPRKNPQPSSDFTRLFGNAGPKGRIVDVFWRKPGDKTAGVHYVCHFNGQEVLNYLEAHQC